MSTLTNVNSLPSSKELRGDARQGLSNPHDNDVLCGRGGAINAHPGNEEFRAIVRAYKRFYLTAREKKEKRLIVDEVLAAIENLNPPGRFLAKDSNTGLWHFLGYEKTRDKASQALRENSRLLKPNVLRENEALHTEYKKYLKYEEQGATRIAEQYYAPHQASYNKYHDENTIPSTNRKENIYSSNLHACNGLSYNRPPRHNTVVECQFMNGGIPAAEGNANNDNRSPVHYNESKEYGMEGTKDQMVSYDCRTVVCDGTPESNKNCLHSTHTSIEPSCNSNRIKQDIDMDPFNMSFDLKTLNGNDNSLDNLEAFMSSLSIPTFRNKDLSMRDVSGEVKNDDEQCPRNEACVKKIKEQPCSTAFNSIHFYSSLKHIQSMGESISSWMSQRKSFSSSFSVQRIKNIFQNKDDDYLMNLNDSISDFSFDDNLTDNESNDRSRENFCSDMRDMMAKFKSMSNRDLTGPIYNV